MIAIPAIALAIGIIFALIFRVAPVGGAGGQYLAVACLAGLDTVFGGIRGGLEGKFNGIVFFTGFISNTLIAFFLAWFGDQIYINLWFAVALVLGARIFTNLSLIRRFIITKIQDGLARRKLQTIAQAAISPEPNV